MELDSRKIQILNAIIDEYITSASPVGSRSISKLEGFNLSSATIRNEMADLEELGYLEQPHTSAGRIPSDKAYRLYVDTMMRRAQLTRDEIRRIRFHTDRKIDDMETLMKQTARVLSDVTQYTAMVLSPELAENRLRHIQLVPLREGRALAVIVTDTGFAREAVIRIPEDLKSDELERISSILTNRFRDMRMNVVSDRIANEMTGELASRREFLHTVSEAIEQNMADDRRNMELSGATNMLHYPEYADLDKAKNFLATVEGRDSLYNMLRRASTLEFTFTIGAENEDKNLKDCSVVTATYRAGDGPVGTFGIIGPTRMQYGRVISVLEHMRRSLSEMLTDFMEED